MNNHLHLKVLLSLITICVFQFHSISQCASCPPVPSCSGGNGPVSNNQNINSGQTFWFSGVGSLNVNFGGGTLIVCGNLTINNMSFNGPSKIYVTPTGKLTVNAFISASTNAEIYNHGTLIVNQNLHLNGANSVLSNCTPTSTISVSGEIAVNGANAHLTNFGNISANRLFLQASTNNSTCLGQGSEIHLVDLTTSTSNSMYAPTPFGCVFYSGTALLTADVTQDPGVFVCAATGSNISGSASFAGATFSSNCTTCAVSLDVSWHSFRATPESNSVQLDWATSFESNNDFFTIEKSTNAVDFYEIGTVKAVGESQELLRYEFQDNSPFSGLSYYRIKQTDFDNKASYSKTISVDLTQSRETLNVFPNPSSNGQIHVSGDLKDMVIFNSVGIDVTSQVLINKGNSLNATIDVSKLTSGYYLIQTDSQVGRFLKL